LKSPYWPTCATLHDPGLPSAFELASLAPLDPPELVVPLEPPELLDAAPLESLAPAPLDPLAPDPELAPDPAPDPELPLPPDEP
jgi:hypothetical protein